MSLLTHAPVETPIACFVSIGISDAGIAHNVVYKSITYGGDFMPAGQWWADKRRMRRALRRMYGKTAVHRGVKW